MPEQQIPINLVFEDELQRSVLERLLQFSNRNYVIGHSFPGYGYGYIKKQISSFNHAAKVMPYLVIVDLDDNICAPKLISEWLGDAIDPNLIFRIAVHDIEAWIIADKDNFANFFGLSNKLMKFNVEEIPRAKTCVLHLMQKSRKPSLRKDMLPMEGSTARIGPNYNLILSQFVKSDWKPDTAAKNSDSLRRAIQALKIFSPTWRK
jgi:hypothetical protein